MPVNLLSWAFAIIPTMKHRRLRVLLFVLFLFALSGEALHTLHAHHDSSHCSACTHHSHFVGTDIHAGVGLAEIFIPHETPQRLKGLSCRYTFTQTLFGRAPPLSHT
jgi:hypothetical protein